MMTRAATIGLAVALLIPMSAAPAAAEIGALDPVPSATLLFPYFEAETTNGSELDTQLTIENATASAQLAHLIVWSDRGVPVLDFDLYLTPRGRTRIGMRALLGGGLPASGAGAGQAGCSFPLATLSSEAVADVRAALSGKHMPSVSDALVGCPGVDHGDTIARGYITVDTVNGCSTTEVESGSYWSTRLAMTNALVGSFAISHGTGKPAYAETALHIEASTTDARTDSSMDSTFYGSLVDWSAADHRERLPSLWTAEFEAMRSDVIVWRDSKRKLTDPKSVGCSMSAQAALDLTSGTGLQYVDEAEQLTKHAAGMPFVRAAGRYALGGASGLPVPYRSGMIMTNLNFAQGTDPPSASGLAQSAVLVVRKPDAIGAAKGATLALGTPLDDGYATGVATIDPVASEYGGASDDRPRAMLDPRSAASLVLPYFEVSLEDANTAQTRFSIASTSASARIVKVSLFTDRGVPTEAFMVYLTGYDIAVIDLRVLFMGGLLARTASDGQDPRDEISPQGLLSQDINFASCSGSLPYPVLNEERLSTLRAAHTGKPVSAWNDACGGRALDDGIARGYVVIDDFTSCSPGPFQASDISGNYVGVRDGLSGSFEIRNRKDGFAFGASLLAVHAVTPALTTGDMTFYGWLDGWGTSGNARREGLPDVWRVPFFNSASTGTTELVLFRPVHRAPVPYPCESVPTVFNGELGALIAYDGDDNSTSITGYQPGFVAGRVTLGEGGIAVPYPQGALEIDLDFQEAENAVPGNETAHMGFVGAVHRLAGNSDSIFSQGFPLHLAGEP